MARKKTLALGLAGAVTALALVAVLLAGPGPAWGEAAPNEGAGPPPGARTSTAATPDPTPTPAIPNLLVTKLVNKDRALSGDMLTYLILLDNTGPGGITAFLTDAIPSGISLVPETVSGGAVYNPSTNTILWSGTVPPGGSSIPSYVFSYRATIDAGFSGAITNTVVVSDGSITTAASARTDVSPPSSIANLTVTKLAKATAFPGEPLTYLILLDNAGATSISLALTDTIPAGASYIAGTLSGGATYDPAINSVLWSGTVPAGTSSLPSQVLQFRVSIDEGISTGILTNTVQVSDSSVTTASSAATRVRRWTFLPQVVKGEAGW